MTATVRQVAVETMFIMTIETADAKTRVYSGTLIRLMSELKTSAYCGIAAMLVPDYRALLKVVSVANNGLVLSLVWFVPETVKWLLGNTKAITLANADTMKLSHLHQESNASYQMQLPNTASDTMLQALRSRILGIRLLINMLVWFLVYFVYHYDWFEYNQYSNHIDKFVVKLPAILMSSVLMECLGEKRSLVVSLLLTALAYLATDCIYVNAWHEFSLIVNIFGICCTTMASASLIVYSNAQFPRSLRHKMLICCYGFGMVGEALAPLAMSVESEWQQLFIFGGCAIAAGLLVLLLPHTCIIKLPNNIAEAEQLT